MNQYIQYTIFSNKNFYEVNVLEQIETLALENKIIVDVGSNIGNHSVFFSVICNAKKVYAFEPQKNVFNILLKNVELNNLSEKVITYNLAISKGKTQGEIQIIDQNDLGTSKVIEKSNGSVIVDSLDNLLYEKEKQISLLKIDVEGMELDVLQGAEKIISRDKPFLVIEILNNVQLKKISSYLNKFGYFPCKILKNGEMIFFCTL